MKNGDTKIGRRLQKKADQKRDKEEIEKYIALNLDGLSDEQKRLKILEISEQKENE